MKRLNKYLLCVERDRNWFWLGDLERKKLTAGDERAEWLFVNTISTFIFKMPSLLLCFNLFIKNHLSVARAQVIFFPHHKKIEHGYQYTVFLGALISETTEVEMTKMSSLLYQHPFLCNCLYSTSLDWTSLRCSIILRISSAINDFFLTSLFLYSTFSLIPLILSLSSFYSSYGSSSCYMISFI